MPRRKSQPWYVRAVLGFFSAIWWIIRNIAKLIAFIAVGIWSLIHRGAKKAQQAHAERSERKAKESVKEQAHKRHGDAKFQPISVQSTTKGSFESFESSILNDSLIVAVAGKRGSGKSSLGFALMENINAKTKRPCFVLGVSDTHLPSYISSVQDIEEVQNDGVVLVDEGAISFSSRSSMSKKNKDLGELLAIARHKNMTLILVTQNTGMLDKNVLNLCDTILLKQGSLLQSEMERPVIKKLYEKATPALDALPHDKKKGGVYVVDGNFEGVIVVGLPSFWSQNLSKNRAHEAQTA